MNFWIPFGTNCGNQVVEGIIKPCLEREHEAARTWNHAQHELSFDVVVVRDAQVPVEKRERLDRVNMLPGPVRIWPDKEDSIIRARAWTICPHPSLVEQCEERLIRHICRALNRQEIAWLFEKTRHKDTSSVAMGGFR